MNIEELSPIARAAGLELRMEEEGLTLTDGTLSLRVDFTQEMKRLEARNLSRELLVRAAAGRKDRPGGLAVDATAGLGEDSLLLSAAGWRVLLFEVNPLIAALLEDGLERALEVPSLKEIVSRMELRTGDSTVLLPALDSPDVVLLDPMFPSRRKSGLVKKKFQLLQRLEQPCRNETELLQAALDASPGKIIIKRPLKGPYLGGVKPSYRIEGSTIRYDCIVLFS